MIMRASFVCTVWRLAIVCCALATLGCASPGPPGTSKLPPIAALPVEKLALFSTYASSDMAIACESQSTSACQEDMVPPEAFLQAFHDSLGSDEQLTTADQGADYELLIANLGRQTAQPWWRELLNLPNDTYIQFGEFTLSWRGVELSSIMLSERFPDTASNTDIAHTLLANWWAHVGQDQIFSASYLYQQLNASNYAAELQLPGTINAFNQTLTEMYRDPIEGVISRYTHPDYSEALLDISVYPIRQPLSNDTVTILDDELAADLAQAQEVAESRSLTLSLIHPPENTQVETDAGIGRRLALQAGSETSEPIYASIYAFRLQDKIIKITTTMPPSFSDDLVREAVPHISVPRESGLMAMLRAKSRPQEAAGGK